MLTGKKIILGVCGSIAAYKAVFLLRLLKKAGAEVKVVITPATTKFVGELTFASLSAQKVFSGLWEENWSEHVTLGNWADLMLIAPATANTLGKLANGLCDNALTAVYLAAKCPVMIAPAMDADMFIHPSTTRNLATLSSFGNQVLPTNYGFLASGLEGLGRMLEPEEIFEYVEKHFGEKPLQGKKILLTAGPTQEAIDPVRYISNHSTGKMGIALAECAQALGAEVTLILGPTSLKPNPQIRCISVVSAQDMYNAALANYEAQDVCILSAAVADYTPAIVSDIKIKKKTEDFQLNLVKTQDILKALGERKKANQLLVGFALETHNELAHAQEKLEKKNLDCIILNSLNDKGAGFAHDTNQITILDKKGNQESFPLKSKTAVAKDIMQKIIRLLEELS